MDKDKKREYNRRYYEKHKEKLLKEFKEYRESHKDECAKREKKWRVENADRLKEYRDSRKEETKEYNRQYYLKNREKEIVRKTAYQKSYSKTPMGRAQRQFQQYKFMDKRNGFGDVIDFDARWIVENIYTKKCAHCDETDWRKLGCNRIDNSKPHTKNNVEPCCFYHNCVLNGKENGVKNLAYNKQ